MTTYVHLQDNVRGFYYGTKTAVEALTGVPQWSIALGYTTTPADGEYGFYDGSAWHWGGGSGGGIWGSIAGDIADQLDLIAALATKSDTGHTHAYLPDTADYTTISTNDAATDVTGAELEELTDGSETVLHTHDATHTHFDDAEGDPRPVESSTGADGTSVNAARRDHEHGLDFHMYMGALGMFPGFDVFENLLIQNDDNIFRVSVEGLTDHQILDLFPMSPDFATLVVKHDLATAADDFLVASGAGAWVKKTLAQTITILRTSLDTIFAPIAKGVTNGDSHDHAGGDGAQVDHGGLAGNSDDDHPQYIKHSLATAVSDFLVASGAGTFVKKTLAEVLTILGLAAGTYTPTLTNIANITSSSVANPFLYLRVLSIVIGGGKITSALSGGGDGTIDFTLPIATTMTTTDDLQGSATNPSASPSPSILRSGADKGRLYIGSGVGTSSLGWRMLFIYIIK